MSATSQRTACPPCFCTRSSGRRSWSSLAGGCSRAECAGLRSREGKTMNGPRLYFRYIGISIRSQLQYRVSFILQSVGHCAMTAIEFLGVWALFHRFGALRGWSLPEAAMFYGMISITFSIADAFARGFDLFGNMIKTGDFDRLLVRPRSTVLQLIGQEFTLRRAGRFVQ